MWTVRQKCRTLWCPQSLQAALHCERWTEISNPLARARTARAKFEPCVAKPDRAPKKSNPSRALRSATNSRCFFLEPLIRQPTFGGAMGVLDARHRFFSLPSLKEKQQVRAFRRVERLWRGKLKGFEFLRAKFRTLWRGRDSRA